MGQAFSQQLWRLYGLFRTEDTHVVHSHPNMLLTQQQRVIILRTWSTLYADIPGNGIAVMLHLLDSHPEVKRAFSFRDLTDFTMIEDPAFRSHSFVFVQAVMAVVENLDTLPTTMMPLLRDLGRKHSYYAHMDAKFFFHLPDALVYVWEDQLKQRFTPMTEKAWRNIFNFIISQMEEGYYMQIIGRDRRGSVLGDSSRGLDSEMSSRHTSFDLIAMSGNQQKSDMASDATDTIEIRQESSSSKCNQPSTDKSLEPQTNFLSVTGSNILNRLSNTSFAKVPFGKKSTSVSLFNELTDGTISPSNVDIQVEKPSGKVMKSRGSTTSDL